MRCPDALPSENAYVGHALFLLYFNLRFDIAGSLPVALRPRAPRQGLAHDFAETVETDFTLVPGPRGSALFGRCQPSLSSAS